MRNPSQKVRPILEKTHTIQDMYDSHTAHGVTTTIRAELITVKNLPIGGMYVWRCNVEVINERKMPIRVVRHHIFAHDGAWQFKETQAAGLGLGVKSDIAAGRAINADHLFYTYKDQGLLSGYLRLETSGIPFAIELPEIYLQSGVRYSRQKYL